MDTILENNQLNLDKLVEFAQYKPFFGEAPLRNLIKQLNEDQIVEMFSYNDDYLENGAIKTFYFSDCSLQTSEKLKQLLTIQRLTISSNHEPGEIEEACKKCELKKMTLDEIKNSVSNNSINGITNFEGVYVTDNIPDNIMSKIIFTNSVVNSHYYGENNDKFKVISLGKCLSLYILGVRTFHNIFIQLPSKEMENYCFNFAYKYIKPINSIIRIDSDITTLCGSEDTKITNEQLGKLEKDWRVNKFTNCKYKCSEDSPLIKHEEFTRLVNLGLTDFENVALTSTTVFNYISTQQNQIKFTNCKLFKTREIPYKIDDKQLNELADKGIKNYENICLTQLPDDKTLNQITLLNCHFDGNNCPKLNQDEFERLLNADIKNFTNVDLTDISRDFLDNSQAIFTSCNLPTNDTEKQIITICNTLSNLKNYSSNNNGLLRIKKILNSNQNSSNIRADIIRLYFTAILNNKDLNASGKYFLYKDFARYELINQLDEIQQNQFKTDYTEVKKIYNADLAYNTTLWKNSKNYQSGISILKEATNWLLDEENTTNDKINFLDRCVTEYQQLLHYVLSNCNSKDKDKFLKDAPEVYNDFYYYFEVVFDKVISHPDKAKNRKCMFTTTLKRILEDLLYRKILKYIPSKLIAAMIKELPNMEDKSKFYAVLLDNIMCSNNEDKELTMTEIFSHLQYCEDNDIDFCSTKNLRDKFDGFIVSL